MRAVIDSELCIGCGACYSACPCFVIKPDGKGKMEVGEGCIGCESCYLSCPMNAITMEEEEFQVEEPLIKEKFDEMPEKEIEE